MLYKVLLIVSQVSIISGSLVLDSTAQRSVYVTDYCPKMNYCPEGAHVMCMYYNANSKMGPRCSNALNITMSQELATKLLDVSNAVRARIAQGKEKGKNGELLPRGYGVFRLNWDTELATFAQVLANQCVLRHDLCRATKKFPDPGQTAGLVRFSYPDWLPVSKSGNFTEPGMSQDKLIYATTQILKSWYAQKNAVTSNMITFYPDWSINPNSQNGRLYMEMIYGSATHMGCGISAYTEYAFYDNNAALNYNSVQIICNYSARPRKSSAVYNTVPPGDTAVPFSRCGCPGGSEGDEECLCQELERKPIYPQMKLKGEKQLCVGQHCDPAVVVLPIFTVEDAPQEKLFNHDSFTNTTFRKTVDDNFQREYDLFENKRNTYTNKTSWPEAHGSRTSQKQSRAHDNRLSHHEAAEIRNRYFDKNHMESKPHESEHRVHKKTSLFSRAAKFELPGTLSLRPTKQTGIKDVVPRKDFTNAKQLVNKYLFGENDLMKPQYNKPMNGEHQNIELPSHDNDHSILHETPTNGQRNNNLAHPLFKDIIHEENITFNKQPREEKNVEHRTAPQDHEIKKIIENENNLHDVFNILNATKPFKISKEIARYQKMQRPHTDTVLNKAEQNVIIQDAFLKHIVSNTNDYNKPLNTVAEETDNKLMALLDTLEQEVKHVELRDKDRQLFDAKIRKIYGKVVGKPVSLLDFNVKKYTDTKPNEKHFADDREPYVMQKSIQQDPKEELLYEKHKKKMDDLDELQRRSEIYRNNYRTNFTRDRNEVDKYEGKNLHRKRYGLRGIRHTDISNEQMRNRYDYENRDFSERKTYRNNDYDRNILDLDEPRHKAIDNKYLNRNVENDRYFDDGIDYRNELDLRGRNEHHYTVDQSIRNKNYYLSNDAANDDPLSMERRRFYQEKLDNIERKLQIRNQRRKNKARHMRPMRPSSRKSESQMDIYGRARFAHGY